MGFPGFAEGGFAIRTFAQVAEILTARGDRISKDRVRQLEHQAFEKMRADAVLAAMWRDEREDDNG